MSRPHDPYRVKPRGKYWYYKFPDMPDFKVILPRISVGNPKFSKRKAELWCENTLRIASVSAREVKTFGDYASDYFLPDSCPWWTRQIGSGKTLTVNTREQHRARLENHILDQFEKHRIPELSPVAIERWIFALDYSSQWKKHIYNTFKIIIDDMHRDRLIDFSSADIRPPVVRNAEKAILPDNLALRFFPVTDSEFRAVWGKGYRSGVFMALLYSTGMRTSEARAVVWEAVNWKLRGIKIIQTINKDGKASVPKGKSIRVIPLPDRTIELLKTLPGHKTQTGLIFPGDDGGILDISTPAQNLKRILKKKSVQIPYNITPHGLRHSYNTRMRRILADAGVADYFSDSTGFLSASEATDAILRAFTGHRSPNMTELYDHPELDKKLEFIDKNFREQIEEYWNLPEPLPIINETDNWNNGNIEQAEGA